MRLPVDQRLMATALRRAADEVATTSLDGRSPRAHVAEGMARAFRIAASMVEDDQYVDELLLSAVALAKVHADGALRHLSDTAAQSVPIARTHIHAASEVLTEALA